jgi:AcrR family transcriptional regulator
VLTQARRLFVQRGYADVSVGEVAEAVGVTKPTLYYHFGSKEGLYAATLSSLMRVVGGHIRRVVESARPLRERLSELAFRYFLVADAPMEPLLRDTSELIGPRRAAEVWTAYEQEVVAPLRGVMHEAIASGEMWAGAPDIFVHAFLGLLDGLTAPGGHWARSEAEHQQMADMLITIFLDGTAPRT